MTVKFFMLSKVCDLIFLGGCRTNQYIKKVDANEEPVIQQRKKVWKWNRKKISKHTKNLNIMTQFIQTGQFVLGSVWAASGLKKEPTSDSPRNTTSMLSIRDWALIEPMKGSGVGTHSVRQNIICDVVLLTGIIDSDKANPRVFEVGWVQFLYPGEWREAV